MKKIIWQTESLQLFESFKNQRLSDTARGGDIYEYQAVKALEEIYQVTWDDLAIRRESEDSLKYWHRLRSAPAKADIVVKSPSVVLHGPIRKSTINIGMLHHIYLKQKNSSLKGRMSVNLLKYKLRKLDMVVVCSSFWQKWMESIGCRNIRTIYNAFDMNEFNLQQAEIDAFAEKYSFRKDRPIVYIGYANKDKGIIEAYDALKDRGYQLVSSGQRQDKYDLPIRFLSLSRLDYLRLLANCDVVIGMSNIEEGWSRVLHEAMLCRKPVVGSGTGGMRELLDGGEQMVCTSFDELPGIVETAIRQKKVLGERGFQFASKFTLQRFHSDWQVVVDQAFRLNATTVRRPTS